MSLFLRVVMLNFRESHSQAVAERHSETIFSCCFETQKTVTESYCTETVGGKPIENIPPL